MFSSSLSGFTNTKTHAVVGAVYGEILCNALQQHYYQQKIKA